MRIALIGSRQLEQKQEYFEDIKLCYNELCKLAEGDSKVNVTYILNY